jgi:hypothetical protein
MAARAGRCVGRWLAGVGNDGPNKRHACGRPSWVSDWPGMAGGGPGWRAGLTSRTGHCVGGAAAECPPVRRAGRPAARHAKPATA